MIRNSIRALVKRLGYDLTLDADRLFSAEEREIISQVRPFTMTSTARLIGLMDAVRYVSANRIDGDIVECGVWRGGSMMAAALMLAASEEVSRNLYLFDTFEGMPPPDQNDATFDGRTAAEMLDSTERKPGHSVWAVAGLDAVKTNMARTGYPADRIHYVAGRVEETIPASAPETIAVLRLDTDWYESTRHELKHLYGRLVPGGILIIDDYGHWLGARKAVDEFLAGLEVPPFLSRLDYTGRIAVKPSQARIRQKKANVDISCHPEGFLPPTGPEAG